MATVDLNPDHDATPDSSDADARAGRRGPVTRLKGLLSDPMSRSGYALVLGSAITSALGMGFWILAARLYDARYVGTTSAMIAAMGFLASGSTIGLKNGFIRFLPISGSSAPRFIRNAYLACISVAAFAALVFVLGQPVWAKELTMLREGPLPALFFIVATVSWTLFVLQDSVLTGLRMASWVPAENAVFAVAKLGLLVVLVGAPVWGIFVAWSIPSIALLLPVNLLILRYLRRRPREDLEEGGIAIRDVVRFAAGDHVAAFLWLGTTELLSLVVLAQAGAESSAYYFLSFQIAYSLYLVTSNFASAFVVEAAIHPDQETALLRRAVVQSARLVVPAALGATLLAPIVLRIMGSEYEANAVPLLRLLLLSAIPQILVGAAVGRARLHRQVRVVILVYLFTAIALFSGATFGLRAGGLEAVGWAWLCTQLVMATVLTPTVLHPPIGRWMFGRLLRRAASARTGVHQRGRSVSARRVLPGALAAAGAEEPTKYALLPSHHDAIVARAMVGGDPVVVRVAMTEAGTGALNDNAEMVQRLSGHRRLPRWQTIVPNVLHRGQVDGRTFVVESFLPGTSLDRLTGEARAKGLERARVALGSLHHATARNARFDDSVARRWIDDPLETLQRLPAVAERADDLQQLRTWLRRALVGNKVKLCWVHGDFWAGNVLVSETSGVPRITGLIDWENGRLDGFAELDLAHLWLAEQPGEMGASLLAALERPQAWPDTRVLDGGDVVSRPSNMPADAVLVLAWLGHVADGAGRSTDHPPSRIWVNRNVLSVLDRIGEITGGAAAGPAADTSPSAGFVRTPETAPAPDEADRAGASSATDAEVLDPDAGDEGKEEAIDDVHARSAAPGTALPAEASTTIAGPTSSAPRSPAYFEVSPDAVADLSRRPGDELLIQPKFSRADAASIVLVVAAVVAWVVGIWGADPRTMDQTGLLALFEPPMIAGLALLTIGFVLALRRNARGWVYALHLVVLILLLHGTPAVLYDTLRYSWAWKHTGIVEYITRTGSVDTTIEVTPIYHSWPGFFAGSALLTELVGARHAARIAMWAPVVFNLLNVLALRFLFRALTGSRRLVWLALWLFFITNWVGQDYFSPQAMAYLLYIVVIGLALRGFRRALPPRPVPAAPTPPGPTFAVLVLLLAVIASSHQITPFLAMVVLAGLVLFRQLRGWYLPAAAAVTMAAWALTVGAGELEANTRSLVDSFGRPISNAEETFQKTATTAASQQIISQAGRAVVVLLALLSAVGLFRLWRRNAVNPPLLIMAATPAALPFATEFGGEAIFRVFLFAVPAMALLGAAAIDPGVPKVDYSQVRRNRDPRVVDEPWPVLRTIGAFVVSVVLLSGFVTAYYGKDQQYYFTQEEIDASAWVSERARPGSLLIEGSRNYPSQFLNYDHFTYVAIAREPEESQEEVLADPARKLTAWLDNDDYADAYLLITRSQKNDVDISGPMPEGSIDDIEQALRASPNFRVAFQNRDAVVFELAKGHGT